MTMMMLVILMVSDGGDGVSHGIDDDVGEDSNGISDGGDGAGDRIVLVMVVMMWMGIVMITQITWEYSKSLIIYHLVQRLVHSQSY